MAQTRAQRATSPEETDPRDTRALVLEEACRQFAAHGERRSTLRAIAENVGVTAAAISSLFGSKEALLEAAVRRAMALDRRRVDALSDVVGPTVRDGHQLQRLLWAELCSSDPWRHVVSAIWLRLQFDAYRTGAPSTELFRDWRQHRIEAWRSLLAQAAGGSNEAACACIAFIDSEDRFMPMSDDPLRPLIIGERCAQFAHAIAPAKGLKPRAPFLFDTAQASSDFTEPDLFQSIGEEAENEVVSKILTAAVDFVAREGAEPLTHRKLAQAADVSLSSTTYYFESIEDILYRSFRFLLNDLITDIKPDLPKTGPTEETPEALLSASFSARFELPEESDRKLKALESLAFELGRHPSYSRLVQQMGWARGELSYRALARMQSSSVRVTRLQVNVYSSVVGALMLALKAASATNAEARRLFAWVFERTLEIPIHMKRG